MMTLKQAKRHAKQMSKLHKEPWMVFIVPTSAPCNQGAAALFNEGRFMACRAAEKDDYEAGGAAFPKIGGEYIQFAPSDCEVSK